MVILVRVIIFLVSLGIIWFFSGLLIDAVNRIARRFHKSGFTVAFFILGFLTSISEISVATNATLEGAPQISVGNLVGASFVILFFLVPLLAVAGNGVALKHTLSRRNMALALGLVLLPAIMVIDGNVTREEGVLLLLAYFTLLYFIRTDSGPLKEIKTVTHGLTYERNTLWDAAKITVGAVFIFIAGHYLVEQAVFFADTLSVPRSLIGLILLSLGTNIPEIAIAVRSILKRHKEVAFGDYLGSTVANVPIFALLPLLNGPFPVEWSEFVATAMLMVPGLMLFYVFSGSKSSISRKEGMVLLAFYAAFLVFQFINLARFATD